MKKIFNVLIGLVLIVSCTEQVPTTIKLNGPVFGTGYNIQYYSKSEINYQKAFDSLFYVINNSLSTYIKDSDISKLNRNEVVDVDNHFVRVFNTSKIIYEQTDGAFDPTIGAVVNAWDFGPEGKIANLDSLKIDSLMVSVGFDKVLKTGSRINKPNGTFLDFNAIAKGYALDVIAEFLDTEGVKDYLIDIGGELRTKGQNVERQAVWRVGVEQPRFDGGQSVIKAISLNDEAMATSGTYRKFKIDDDGNRYAHIIDTKTGYPSKTNVLSVSVIAEDCMTADAYATAFQAMGIERVSNFLKSHPKLKVFFIFENDNQELETLALNNFPE